jgi:hypothetical protein
MQRIKSRGTLTVHHCVSKISSPFKENLRGSYSVEKFNKKETESEVLEHG